MEENVVWYIYPGEINLGKELKSLCPKCIPMPDPGPKENIEIVNSEVHPFVIATDMGELNAEYMKIAKTNNIKVFVDEKIGNEEEWEKILEWGTDGIQTNDPEKLIEFLKNKQTN